MKYGYKNKQEKLYSYNNKNMRRGIPKTNPSTIKDIRASKFTNDGPDMKRVKIKIAQSTAKKNKPSMPKMPWEKI